MSLTATGRRALAALPVLDRPLLPLRLARARRHGSYVDYPEASLRTAQADIIALNFPSGDAAWNGIGEAADGTVYCVAGTHALHAGARLFAHAPGSRDAIPVADLDDVLPKPGPRTIPHGKVHVELVAVDDHLVGATHVGYYPNGYDRRGRGSAYAPYPGGWFFSLRGRTVNPLAQAPCGEGIITMAVDARRRRAFGLSWPHGLLLELDLSSNALSNHGRACGTGDERKTHELEICRSLGIEEPSGALFWSQRDGTILRHAEGLTERVAALPHGQMWRKVAWHPADRAFYGLLWRSGTIFRFDPQTLRCEELGKLTVQGLRTDAPSTLAFVLDPSAHRIHTLATGPGVIRSREVQLPRTVVYLTHDLKASQTQAHGALRAPDGRWVTRSESLQLTGEAAFTVCWVEVPQRDRSRHAREVRELRRDSIEQRFQGYAEELALVRFQVR